MCAEIFGRDTRHNARATTGTATAHDARHWHYTNATNQTLAPPERRPTTRGPQGNLEYISGRSPPILEACNKALGNMCPPSALRARSTAPQRACNKPMYAPLAPPPCNKGITRKIPSTTKRLPTWTPLPSVSPQGHPALLGRELRHGPGREARRDLGQGPLWWPTGHRHQADLRQLTAEPRHVRERSEPTLEQALDLVKVEDRPEEQVALGARRDRDASFAVGHGPRRRPQHDADRVHVPEHEMPSGAVAITRCPATARSPTDRPSASTAGGDTR